ncbi:unnamed protein product [Alopecurus aequalis]
MCPQWRLLLSPSFLAVAKSPPKPSPPRLRLQPPPLDPSVPVCFCCLSSEHPRRHCWDPVRCRRSVHIRKDCRAVFDPPPSLPSSSPHPPSSSVSRLRMDSLHVALATAADVVAAQELAHSTPPPSPVTGRPTIGSSVPTALPLAPAASSEEEDPKERVSWHTSDGSSIPAASSHSVASEPDEHLRSPVLPDAYLPGADDLDEPHRPDYLGVYFPHVHMPHYDNLAFAYLDPPHASPATIIHQASLVGCGPNRVSLLSSSRGAKLAIFLTPQDRKNAVLNGPYVGHECTIHFERHDEADNRFLFQHESFMALTITDYLHEHWFREHIQESSVPFANPHQIDPIRLTGLDYTVVLLTVKTETLADIPSSINFKNHSGCGSVGKVSIIAYEDIIGSDPPSDTSSLSGGSDAISLASSFDGVEIDGEMGFGKVLAALGMAPPMPDANTSSSVAPAASLLDRALAAAPSEPVVRGEPLHSKPKRVVFKLHLGYFDIFALGSLGERAFFRIPMCRADDSSGCQGLTAVNLATASVGTIHSIATVDDQHRTVLSVDVLAYGNPLREDSDSSLSHASSLLLGGDPSPARPLALVVASYAHDDGHPIFVPPRIDAVADAALPGPEAATLASASIEADDLLCRRSARLAGVELATKLTMLDKAMLRKAARIDGEDIAEIDGACEIPSDALASSASSVTIREP